MDPSKIIFSYVIAKLDEGTFGVFRLNGFPCNPKLMTTKASLRKAKEALKSLATEVAENMHGTVVEEEVPLKHQHQLKNWAKTIQIVSSKASIVVAPATRVQQAQQDWVELSGDTT